MHGPRRKSIFRTFTKFSLLWRFGLFRPWIFAATKLFLPNYDVYLRSPWKTFYRFIIVYELIKSISFCIIFKSRVFGDFDLIDIFSSSKSRLSGMKAQTKLRGKIKLKRGLRIYLKENRWRRWRERKWKWETLNDFRETRWCLVTCESASAWKVLWWHYCYGLQQECLGFSKYSCLQMTPEICSV